MAFMLSACGPSDDDDAVDDDDCDGLTDEGFDDLYESCEVGVGVCKRFGISQCSADGKVTECSVLPGDPSKELCDNLDNDCDGDADEDFPTVDDVCTAGIGGCKTTGVVACTDDGLGAECSAVEGNAVAETCNGVDDDCDGKKDNNIDNVELCANQNGVCAGSTRTCNGAGGWSVCVGPEYGPQWEQTELACDGLDNDCDGDIPADESDADGDLFLLCEDDCDDADDTINPDAAEDSAAACEDGVDNDCDASTDLDDEDCADFRPVDDPDDRADCDCSVAGQSGHAGLGLLLLGLLGFVRRRR